MTKRDKRNKQKGGGLPGKEMNMKYTNKRPRSSKKKKEKKKGAGTHKWSTKDEVSKLERSNGRHFIK